VTELGDPPAYGWAFVVGRGRRKGYKSLLVPDFLATSNEYGVIGQLGTDGDDRAPRITQLHGLAAGDIGLSYRTYRPTAADLGIASTGPPTDEFGRPLELLYGFVVRAAEIKALDDTDFLTARAQAIGTYQRFLADEAGFELEASSPYALLSAVRPSVPSPAGAEAASPTASASSEPPVAAPSPRRPEPETDLRPSGERVSVSPVARRNVVLVALVLVVLSAIIWFVLLRSRGPVTDVQVLPDPETGPIDCTSPITINGTITTNGSAKVRYHWQSDGNPASSPAEISLESARTIIVQTKVQPNANADTFSFTQSLVVDKPNDKDGKRTYEFTCR
jgi:hypothetical protein